MMISLELVEDCASFGRDSGAMSLRIYLLGQFKLQVDDQPLELQSRPAQSLFAYLLLNAGVTQRREKLASLLWPEATETNARSYLRQALWRIRKALCQASLTWEDYLKTDDIHVTFNDQSDYCLDVESLLANFEAKSTAELIAAAQLYQGELLPGFYDEWVILERDRFQAAYHQLMNQLLERLLQAGNWDEVLHWGEAWIRLGHLPEPAYRALLRAYAGLGNQSMINATYRRCVQALDRDLGVEPSPETQRLYEEIRSGILDASSPFPVPVRDIVAKRPLFLEDSAPQPVEKPLFVARQSELERLDQFLELALKGHGRMGFVIGEMGSGKTALIEEFTRRAQITYPDLIVAGGNCNAHTGLGDPYLPFREILLLLTGDVEAQWAAGTITREHARHLWQTLPLTVQALVQVGPNLIDTFVSGSALAERAAAFAPDEADWFGRLSDLLNRKVPPTSRTLQPQQSDLFEQYTKVLQLVAQQSPLLLVVDDLQWADPGSINLLFHLGRHIGGGRILIIGAYRSEEVAIGRAGKRHPLHPIINEFQRRFGDITIDLSHAARRKFVEAIIESEPNELSAAFKEMLYQQTNGHPLFTIELLRGMQERGDLVRNERGHWVEEEVLDWETLPARVEAVIAERIGRLERPLLAALQLACVQGGTFTAEVVAQIQSIDEQTVFQQLSTELDKRHRLIRAQSIDRVNGQLLSQYRFRHNLFQKYLYAGLDDVERVHFHELVGTALETLYGTSSETTRIALQLAWHFQEARNTEKAIHYLHLVGNRAVQMYAYLEGITHLTKARDLLLTLPESLDRDRQELDLQFSLGQAWLGNIPSPEWRNTFSRARELSQQLGMESELSRVLGELSIFYYVRAEYPEAQQLAKESLMLAQKANDPFLEVLSHWHLGFILFGMGEFPSAHTHNNHVVSSYRPEQHHHRFIQLHGSDSGTSALAYEVCCLWCLGYPAQAQQLSEKVLALAYEQDHAFSLADVLCFAGCLFNEMTGNAEQLKKHAEALIKLSKEIGLPSWLGVSNCYWGIALTNSGEVQRGIAIIKEGVAIRRSRKSHCYLSGILASLAKAQMNAGQLREGLDSLNDAFSFVENTGERHYEAELYRLRGELLLELDVETEAEHNFLKALDIARNQCAKSWELRAAISLAQLWQNQGKAPEARQLLAPIYNWFTEGFDTPDLQEAQKLLEVF